MTTSKSPAHVLRAQARKIADTLKRAAAGEKIAEDPLGKIEASKARGVVDFAIVMDDKILKIVVPWSTINALEFPLLCDYIFDQMSEAKHVAN